ncbi:SPBc2 prophage-derived glycosyltransferase SunS [bacterium HR15]|nr:SPBc2 prophage-derived glycosyltransferase SunS [bacterium HR15]
MSQQRSLPPTLWQGGIFSAHSLARVNRELIRALLLLDPHWQVHLIANEAGDPIENAEQHPLRRYLLLGGNPPPANGWQVWVRHQFPPDWSLSPAPLAIIQPWEFGAAPREWVEQIRARNAQLWTPSRFVYETFLKSGVPGSQLRLVPNGVNPDQFRPDLPPLKLDTLGITNVPRESFSERYKFLFVGGSVRRKGIDVLLQAYRAAFKPGDEVLLIVKDFGTQDFYSTRNYQAQLMAWARDPSAPPLLYIPDTLPESAMASLYNAADCLVHPYRAEGFGLPIAEAMACGLLVITTGFGACLDFCNEQTAYLLPAEVRPLSSVEGYEVVGTPFWAEPSLDALIEAMRTAFSNPEAARQKGAAAREHIVAHFSWAQAASLAAHCLQELAENATSRVDYYHIGLSRLQNEDSETALQLFAYAIDAEPLNPHLYEAAVHALLQQNRWEDAETLLNKALTLLPDAPNLQAQKAWILLYTEREQQAYPLVMKLLRAGYADPHWLREVVLPLRNYFCCLSGTKSKAAQRARALEEWLAQYHIPIPDEPLGTRITLCIVARNEAEFLPECLDSVQGVVDEIILVDTGSTDATPEIALRYGAKVLSCEWTEDFSVPRNLALQHATGDWILVLDADERLHPRSRAIIREGARHPQFAAYYIEIVNILDKHNPQDAFIHRAIRMFRRLPYARWEGRVHEQILPSLLAHGGKPATLRNAQIIHWGYEAEVMRQRGKSQRNVQLLQQTLQENPQDAFQWFNLGNTLYNQGDYQGACNALQQACEQIDPGEDYAPLAWSQWISSLQMLKRYEDAIQVGQRALKQGLEHPLIYFTLAQSYLLNGQGQEAVDALQKARQCALRIGLLSADGETLLASSGYTGDPTVVTFKWHLTMGRALLLLNRLEEAGMHLQRVLHERPEYAEAHLFYAEWLRRKGRYEEAAQHYEQASRHPQIALAALQDAAHMWWEQKRFDRALPLYARLAELQPEQEVWWHRWVHAAEQTHNNHALCEAFAYLERHGKPVSAGVHINWGRALCEMGQYAEGLEHFIKAINQDPQNANALFNAGDVLYQIGAYAEAADAYSAALERDPYNPQGWFVLGNCYFRLGVYDAARIAFEQALHLDPNHAPARQNLELTTERIRLTAA